MKVIDTVVFECKSVISKSKKDKQNMPSLQSFCSQWFDEQRKGTMRSTRVQGWPLHRCHSEYYQLLGWDCQFELETTNQSEKKRFHS